MIVTPFRGLRPRADLAAAIPSLPYDVLDSEEARALAKNDPYTFLHVIKAEIDLDPSVDVHDDSVYARARRNFQAMRDDGWLVADRRPAYYVYRQRMGEHVQTGLVGLAEVDDYKEGRIKRHEHTRPDKVEDRARHAIAIGAHAGPVFLTYRDRDEVDALVDRVTRAAPEVNFVAKDGIEHALWVIDDPQQLAAWEAALRAIPETYIADGHHRAAAYERVAMESRTTETRRFLAVHFPSSQLKILDYNRCVKDLNGLDADGLCRRVREAGFEIRDPWLDRRPPGPGSIAMFVGTRWRLLAPAGGSRPTGDPVRDLDVSILQDRILAPILGIGDPRKDARIGFVGGIRGIEELERRVRAGDDAVAFALYPTQLADVMRVADAGNVMPPKSTWFEPKLRSGMVVHPFDSI